MLRGYCCCSAGIRSYMALMLRSPRAARMPVLTGDSPKLDGSFRGGTGLFRRVPLALAVLPLRLLPRLCRPLRSADAGVSSPGEDCWRVMAAEGDAALLARCMCARALAFLADPAVGLPCSSRALRLAIMALLYHQPADFADRAPSAQYGDWRRQSCFTHEGGCQQGQGSC